MGCRVLLDFNKCYFVTKVRPQFLLKKSRRQAQISTTRHWRTELVWEKPQYAQTWKKQKHEITKCQTSTNKLNIIIKNNAGNCNSEFKQLKHTIPDNRILRSFGSDETKKMHNLGIWKCIWFKPCGIRNDYIPVTKIMWFFCFWGNIGNLILVPPK